MSKVVLLDTSIFVGLVRTGLYADKVDAIDGLLRTSSVVLAELLRGVKGDREVKFFRALESNHPILVPTVRNWIESGEVLGRISSDKGFSADKLRDLHFDVLIALTARSCGALLITSNRKDFELIRNYRDFELETW